MPFACNETHELGEELVGSYRYQVHLQHWLESNNYGGFLSDNDLYIKVSGWFISWIGQSSKLDGIIAQHNTCNGGWTMSRSGHAYQFHVLADVLEVQNVGQTNDPGFNNPCAELCG